MSHYLIAMVTFLFRYALIEVFPDEVLTENT